MHKFTAADIAAIKKMVPLVGVAEVADAWELSPMTIRRVLWGKLRACDAPKPVKSHDMEKRKKVKAEYVRCPGCGGKVLMPCYACAIRERRIREEAEKPKSARQQAADESRMYEPSGFEIEAMKTLIQGEWPERKRLEQEGIEAVETRSYTTRVGRKLSTVDGRV